MSVETQTATIDVRQSVKAILNTIEREREREIISRRFGLFERKETLEQIGELLGITRERVRQLEKAILARLKTQAAEGLSAMKDVDATLVAKVDSLGRVATINRLTTELLGTEAGERERAHVAFLATLAPSLTVNDENDDFYQAAALASVAGDEKTLRELVSALVSTIKQHGQPVDLKELKKLTGGEETPEELGALASVSKQLANLKDNWGLTRWPTVNPKNIRDKIFVILQDGGKPMHFSDIASAIKESSFKRRDVTTQAIHNELIKDGRFVLIGRGIYALKDWGYKQGTVADTISDVLRKEGGPLHRDEIVKRVLEHRQVKETTILLNLQGKSQFKRVAKATYELANANAEAASA